MQESTNRSPWSTLVGRDGFPCGNFAVAVNVTRSGRPLGLILRNAGRLGRWLEPASGGSFHFAVGDSEATDGSMQTVKVRRRWPFAVIEGSDPRLGPVSVATRVWAPVGKDDEDTSALPLIQIEVTLRNERHDPCLVGVRWACGDILEDGACALNVRGLVGAQAGDRLVACDHPCEWDPGLGMLVAKETVAGNGEKRLRFLVVVFDPEGAAARRFADCAEVAAYAIHNWDDLYERTRRIEAAIPVADDAAADDALRWYTGASVYLTKCNSSGAVLTMGYSEFSQRDGYWASWPHLVLWPSMERRMIEESAAALGARGKVPTCILPNIERGDDLESNAYFVLRALRYATHWQDREFLQRLWATLRRAADWLVDGSAQGLPTQRSVRGESKDPHGVEMRFYSPHTCLLYLAMLSRMRSAAVEQGDAAGEERYAHAFAKGMQLLNMPAGHGGLWNGSCYVQAWQDGSTDNRVLLEQCVGIVLGVVEREKACLILKALEANWGPFGTRETWPYYPESFGYPGGVCHNGGVWPWLCFVESWARLIMGQRDIAMERIRTVAIADLEREEDWMPHEYLHGETGENRGAPIQACNGCLFGVVRFGIPGNGRAP